jgi:hypothetical protein
MLHRLSRKLDSRRSVRRLSREVDSRRRRLVAIIALCALLFVVTAVVAVWVNSVTSSPAHSLSDRMAEDTVIIAGGTLALALIAAVVAVMAFAAATGRPDLKLQISFPFSNPNDPVFFGEAGEDGLFVADINVTGTISLLNESDYSAKNPSVVVHLNAMAFTPDESTYNKEWVVTSGGEAGVKTVQWDGGPIYSIHGHSRRQLPELDLSKVREEPELPGFFGPSFRPSLEFEILAEGYRRVVNVPVRFTEQGRPFGSFGSFEGRWWI